MNPALIFSSAQDHILEGEAGSRNKITGKLAGTDDSKLDSVFMELTFEYWSVANGAPANTLCSGLVHFFSEYETEYQIHIVKMDGKRTLKKVWRELHSFFIPYYENGGPAFRAQSNKIVHGDECTLQAAHRAVRSFLIEKASKEIVIYSYKHLLISHPNSSSATNSRGDEEYSSHGRKRQPRSGSCHGHRFASSDDDN
jgi:hypothetical protein